MKIKLVAPTPFGSEALLWSDAGKTPTIFRVLLSPPGRPAERQAADLFPEAPPASCPAIDEVSACLRP